MQKYNEVRKKVKQWSGSNDYKHTKYHQGVIHRSEIYLYIIALDSDALFQSTFIGKVSK